MSPNVYAGNSSQQHNTVVSCPWNGAGYLKLPGFDTCLKLGGHLQADAISANLIGDQTNALTDTAAYIESRLSFNTKTQIQNFKLATFTDLDVTWDQETSHANLELSKGAVEFSGDHFSISGGMQNSLYTGFTGYSGLNLMGTPWSDNTTLQATVKFNAGPLTFGVSIEDIVYENLKIYDNPTINYPHLKTSGDYAFIGMSQFQNEFLDIKLSGGLIVNSNTELLVRDYDTSVIENFLKPSNTNYAVNLNTEFEPFDIFQIGFGGQLATGAVGYTGFNMSNYKNPSFDFQSVNAVPTPNYPGYYFLEGENPALQTALLNDAGALSYTMTGGFKVYLVENVHLTFDASYQHFDVDHAGIVLNGTGIGAQSALIWTPTTYLGVSLGAGYSSYTLEGSLATSSPDMPTLPVNTTANNLHIGTRVKYVFDPS